MLIIIKKGFNNIVGDLKTDDNITARLSVGDRYTVLTTFLWYTKLQ